MNGVLRKILLPNTARGKASDVFREVSNDRTKGLIMPPMLLQGMDNAVIENGTNVNGKNDEDPLGKVMKLYSGATLRGSAGVLVSVGLWPTTATTLTNVCIAPILQPTREMLDK